MANIINISFFCIFVVNTLCAGANVAEKSQVAALKSMNSAREDKGLSAVKFDDKLTSEATKCAEFFGLNKKLGNCPYYDKNKTAYLSFSTTDTEGTQEDLVRTAFKSWKNNGRISAGMGDWFKKFGVGFNKTKTHHYITVLLS